MYLQLWNLGIVPVFMNIYFLTRIIIAPWFFTIRKGILVLMVLFAGSQWVCTNECHWAAMWCLSHDWLHPDPGRAGRLSGEAVPHPQDHAAWPLPPGPHHSNQGRLDAAPVHCSGCPWGYSFSYYMYPMFSIRFYLLNSVSVWFVIWQRLFFHCAVLSHDLIYSQSLMCVSQSIHVHWGDHRMR